MQNGGGAVRVHLLRLIPHKKEEDRRGEENENKSKEKIEQIQIQSKVGG
jgi:hypothetical protein